MHSTQSYEGIHNKLSSIHSPEPNAVHVPLTNLNILGFNVCPKCICVIVKIDS